jgi:hypothetical protein
MIEGEAGRPGSGSRIVGVPQHLAISPDVAQRAENPYAPSSQIANLRPGLDPERGDLGQLGFARDLERHVESHQF